MRISRTSMMGSLSRNPDFDVRQPSAGDPAASEGAPDFDLRIRFLGVWDTSCPRRS
jgi:hypothetical protein